MQDREELYTQMDESEALHRIYDFFHDFEKEALYFCSKHDCKECPFFKYIDQDAHWPAEDCPIRIGIRELNVKLLDACRGHGVPDATKQHENKYEVSWINDQSVFYKGFDEDLACRDFQYRVGEHYHMDGDAELCSRGYHFCCNPLEVFDFYAPPYSRFGLISVSHDASVASDYPSTKRCATSITIEAELPLSRYVHALEVQRGYKYEMGPWVAHEAILVNSDYTLYWCNAPVGINHGNYSTMILKGTVGVAFACNSAVLMNEEYACTVAVAERDESVVNTRGSYGVAIAAGYRSIGQADGHGSVAIANVQDSTAITTGKDSVAVAVGGGDSFLRLEGENGIAVSRNHTVVTGHNCTVIVPCFTDHGFFSLKAVEGTLIICLDAKGNPRILRVSKDGPVKPGQSYAYCDLMYAYEYVTQTKTKENN